ncbi:PREDICTED: uncharacterized protein LOC109158864 [Ipomoea nil]|uniref:uncharacterized protein LOC109158864 n=1 Tax=Ipomoea nil TaxID=35883 RepID=UPI000901A022|nr:PREDICTED: uncharacterized protein LOC109158864 [Ipomoea nil]
MSHHLHQDSFHDPLKPWKHIPFQTLRITDAFTNFMKGFLGICLVGSISLFSFLAFSKWFGCSEYQNIFISTSSEFSTGYDVIVHSDETNISHILFGIGGSAKTWNYRRHYCEAWWKPNVTRGFVWLDERPQENESWPETSPRFQVSQDTSRFKYTCPYGSRAAVRIARIVKESFELGLENVRWLVMGDDDTVFLPENLVAVLSKYDHKQMYYIGSNSESVEQDEVHSYTMAYGGGGFAISYALAAELVRVLDGCIDRYAAFYGSDQKIGGCMSEIGVPLTKELGFHQMDIRQDPYGVLAAHPVAPLVSLHHLDYVQPLFPGTSQEESVKKLVEAYKLDPSRTLQHSFCYDLSRNWSISVAWGYTIQLYPTLVNAKELATPFRTFLTWKSWNEGPFTFDVRSMSSDPCEMPLIFYLNHVHSLGNGSTVSTYTRPKVDGNKCQNETYAPALLVHSFNVSAQILSSEIWKKVPRRQCCEVVNDGDGADGILHVKLRRCNQWESVTPP